MLIDVDALKADLRSTVVEVIFTKQNGETRRMRATLMPSQLPQVSEQGENTQQLLNEEDNHSKAIRVWDLDAQGWRSFRTDRIISVQGVNSI